ncbi:hypothetical protein BANORC5_37090 [Bacteroides nordii]|nr:hypothetical protein BANORC5_37090 [Bacteroides nordii]
MHRQTSRSHRDIQRGDNTNDTKRHDRLKTHPHGELPKKAEHEKQPTTREMATDGHDTVPPETDPDGRERKGNSKA